MTGSATTEPTTTAANIAGAIAATAAQTDSKRQFPSESVKILAENGLLGLLVPAEFSGVGANAETFARIVQTVGGACASTGMIFTMHCCAVETIAKFNPSLSEVLVQAARGKHLSTLACSERGTGANFYASDSTSRQAKDGYILNGQKAFVTSGGHADSYVVSARAVDSDSSLNTTMYLLPKASAGMAFVGNWEGLGLRGNSSVSMSITDCKVPVTSQIGDQGQGLGIEMSTILPRFLLGSAAVYNGIAEAAVTAAINHLKNRSHSHTGEKLNALPVVRHKIAQMKIAVDASVALMRTAARSWDAAGSPVLVDLLAAKQIACRTAVEVSTLALETCGGIAYSAALPIERHLRDAQAGVVMAPSNDMLLDLVGRAILDMPLM